MIVYLVWVFASLYVTYVMVESTIMDEPRGWAMTASPWLEELLSCYKCSAFWAALFVRSLFFVAEPTNPWFAAIEVVGIAGATVFFWAIWDYIRHADQQ